VPVLLLFSFVSHELSTTFKGGVIIVDKFKILIVDDSKLVHVQIKDMLSNLDFEGRHIELDDAFGYEDFRKAYEPGKYALILTDLVMEEDISGIKVINHIRHELGDTKTRIVLMTANPEKVPRDLLLRDYDVNSYIEKQSMNEFTLKLTVVSMLKTYKDIIAFEKAINSIDYVMHNSKSMEVEDMLIETYFQIRSFIKLRLSNVEIEGEIYVDKGKIFPPSSPVARTPKKLKERYSFEVEILEKQVNLNLSTSKKLSKTDVEYVNALLSNLKYSYFYTELSGVENDLILRLSNLIETRSEETGNHVKRVAEISYLLAVDCGFDAKEAELLKSASGLHDIGKVGIPDHVLNKPGKLDENEFAIMKEHSVIGFEILKNSRWKVFELGAMISLQHHERWDGTGYPYGLKDGEIAPEARMVQVADVFEALTHDRCYRPAWPIDKAVEYMCEMRGKQFAPEIIDVFTKRLSDVLDILNQFKD